MFTLSHTATRLCLISFVLFLMSAGGSGVMWHSLSVQGADFVDKLQLATNVAAQEDAVQTLHALVSDTEVERVAVASYFLDVVQIAQLLEQLEQYAIQNDLALQSNQLQQLPNTENDNEDITQVRIPYQVAGERANVLAFIELLEALPYHGYMERLTITAPSNDQTRATANVAIVVSYRQYDRD